MLERMKNFITQNQLFEKNQPIICATSGGVDSICLIHLLKDLGYKPILAHVNHHKRMESEIEQKEMEVLAKQLEIPFELFSFYDSNIDNFQNNAHHARYDFFKEIADKYHTPWIATAHHLDDQAETILMRLCSGSNLYGYAGISICLEQNNYKIARPLLFASKNELYEYAKKMNYTFFEDISNASDDYFRNRLRHHILPDLKKETPALLEKLQEFSIQAKEAFQFIRNQSIKILNQQNNIISVEDFLLLDIAIQKDV
ncbi:MAG: tRNA lysidine(34) synthetase TilS, partial [Anaeroplasmataceae bacterium]|nr:tRNA lysidine(34) synthetase TilS [Anaeroplasmataceae bacterium]